MSSAALSDFPSKDDCWNWIRQINAFGPRLTGTSAHEACIDFLAAELERIGLQVEETVHSITRWIPQRVALSTPEGVDIRVASPYPYSGQTAENGITAELVWFRGIPRTFHRARGRIAVVSLKRRDLTQILLALCMKRRTCLPDQRANFPFRIRTPLLTGLMGVPLDKARREGVRAVICVYEGISPAQLEGQVLPFTTPYADLPAVWVNEAEGERLRSLAANRREVTLTLTATLERVPTLSLHAILPGQRRDETVIINTHTDGPNACEENGSAGILALARHFSRQSISARRRTMVFLLATGHFQIPQIGRNGDQATSAWLAAHPELWDGKNGHARAMAGLTIEHLGCMEWRDDDCSGAPAPTGKFERDIVYTTNTQLNRTYVSAAHGRSRIRSVTVFPRSKHVMLGEGQPLYSAGIPVISTCPIPDYLCQILPGGGLERLDPDYAYEQILTFARIATELDKASSQQLGCVPFSNLRKFIKSIADKLRIYRSEEEKTD